jgi:hypothetical protein
MLVSLDTVSSSMTLAPSNLMTTLLIRDGSCRLSGCREQLQVAHVSGTYGSACEAIGEVEELAEGMHSECGIVFSDRPKKSGCLAMFCFETS